MWKAPTPLWYCVPLRGIGFPRQRYDAYPEGAGQKETGAERERKRVRESQGKIAHFHSLYVGTFQRGSRPWCSLNIEAMRMHFDWVSLSPYVFITLLSHKLHTETMGEGWGEECFSFMPGNQCFFFVFFCVNRLVLCATSLESCLASWATMPLVTTYVLGCTILVWD